MDQVVKEPESKWNDGEGCSVRIKAIREIAIRSPDHTQRGIRFQRDDDPVVGDHRRDARRQVDGRLVLDWPLCGAQMRERFIPRILKAKPETLLNDSGDNLDPAKILACMMQREKPGGHTERSVAIGTIEVAVWDAVAKIAGKPLHAVLAERYNSGKVLDKVQCYVGGGWYAPDKGIKELQDEIRARLDEAIRR
jgi:hypothetical protein